MTIEVAVEKKRARQRLPVKTRRLSDGMKQAAVWLLLAGIVSLAIWYLTNDGSMMSMLLALVAISTITLSVLLYFLSPVRSVRSEVCDAMAITGTLEIRNMLASLHCGADGIYVPDKITGLVRMFIPLSDDLIPGALATVDIKNSEKKLYLPQDGITGMLVSPPGYGLYTYARNIGARFSGDGLEGEIGDVMENSLELADSVEVRSEGDLITVTLKNIADYELCRSIRKTDPSICTITGCPVCSAVGCMIANGTGQKISISSVTVTGKTVTAEFRIIGE